MHKAKTIRTLAGTAGQRWALVLAAGDGTRLGHLTRDPLGRPTPKQFCSVSGGPSLLQETLQRGARLVGYRQVVTVVAERHGHWWRQDTSSLPPENVVVQPSNRGTAAGILLPLLTIAQRDPEARVVVLPSDHFIENEAVLDSALRSALDAVEREPSAVVLLGITPDRPDPELGWILPEAARRDRIGRVERFVEKPAIAVARELQQRGGLWNSFIFAARATTLLDLYRRTLPGLLERLAGAVAWDAWGPAETDAVPSAYLGLESRDFSRDLLEPSADTLRVLPVAPCGWSDLGTPERLARCTAGLAGRLLSAAAPTTLGPRGGGLRPAALSHSHRPVLAAVV